MKKLFLIVCLFLTGCVAINTQTVPTNLTPSKNQFSGTLLFVTIEVEEGVKGKNYSKKYPQPEGTEPMFTGNISSSFRDKLKDSISHTLNASKLFNNEPSNKYFLIATVKKADIYNGLAANQFELWVYYELFKMGTDGVVYTDLIKSYVYMEEFIFSGIERGMKTIEMVILDNTSKLVESMDRSLD